MAVAPSAAASRVVRLERAAHQVGGLVRCGRQRPELLGTQLPHARRVPSRNGKHVTRIDGIDVEERHGFDILGNDVRRAPASHDLAEDAVRLVSHARSAGAAR
jgi:hypothetical protein